MVHEALVENECNTTENGFKIKAAFEDYHVSSVGWHLAKIKTKRITFNTISFARKYIFIRKHSSINHKNVRNNETSNS